MLTIIRKNSDQIATLTFSNIKIKKPYRSKKNVLTIHSPKSCCIKIANTLSIDTGITINLPEKSTVHLATKFKGQKIRTIEGAKTQRLWLTLLNESYFDKYKIQKGDIIGYLVLKLPNLKIKYEKNPPVKTWRPPNNYLPKEWSKIGRRTGKRKKRQTGGFLNRYDFAYAGRDVVNQVGKVAPSIINKATADISKIVQERIDQAIRTGGAEVERIAPKIIKGAIEEVYKTPFRLLGNLGKKHFQKIKQKIFK